MEQRQGLLPSPPPPCLAWNPHHASRSPRVHPPTPPLTVGGLPMFPACINRGWCVIGKTLNIGPPHGPDHWSFFFFFNLFIYFWLHWVFVAARGLSLVAASRGYSSLGYAGFLLWWLLLLRSMGSRHTDFSSCGTGAQNHLLQSPHTAC